MGVNKLYSSYFLYFLISLQKESMGEAEKLLGLIFFLERAMYMLPLDPNTVANK